MRLTGGKHSGERQRGRAHNSQTLLDQIGLTALITLVWRSIPLPLRLIAFPYGFVVYRKFLGASNSLEQLNSLHSTKYSSSLVFRLLRPRYHRVKSLLARLEKKQAEMLASQSLLGDGHETKVEVEESTLPEMPKCEAFFADLFTVQGKPE